MTAKPHSRRRPLSVLVLVAGLALVATACSDGLRDAARSDGAQRSASGFPDLSNFGNSFIQTRTNGDPNTSVDVDKFCSEVSPGLFEAAAIATCFIFDNQTSRFTAPGQLSDKFALTVPYAECGRDDAGDRALGDPCVATGKRYGRIRNYKNDNGYGIRVLTPNPFLNLAAIQFRSSAQKAGTEELVYVGSTQAPLNLNQTPAKAFFSTPWTDDNYGDCRGSGQFIACSLDRSSWSVNGDFPRPRYTFRTLPVQITINNNSGRPMSIQSGSRPVPGVGFLVDPSGTSTDLTTIPSGGRVIVGGYRSTNSNEGHSWTANYCIDSLSGCVPVSITIKMENEGGKWVNKSTCFVNNTSATATYKCNQPALNDDDAWRQAIVSITNF